MNDNKNLVALYRVLSVVCVAAFVVEIFSNTPDHLFHAILYLVAAFGFDSRADFHS